MPFEWGLQMLYYYVFIKFTLIIILIPAERNPLQKQEPLTQKNSRRLILAGATGMD